MVPKNPEEMPRESYAFIEGVFVTGAIPEGHEGPYQPSAEEYVAAVQDAAKYRIAQLQTAHEAAVSRAQEAVGRKETP